MADSKKTKDEVTARDGVIVQGEVLVPQDPKDAEPKEMLPDASVLRAYDSLNDGFPQHFAHGEAAVVTDEQRKAADESKPATDDGKKKVSHLYKEATYWSAPNAYSHGVIESQFDDGTVDINTHVGRFRRVPFSEKSDDNLGFPRVELGKV